MRQLTASVEQLRTSGMEPMEIRGNPISLCVRLPLSAADARKLGGRLFRRGLSGARVVTGEDSKEVAGHTFQCYGAHTSVYPHLPYLTLAAAAGMGAKEVDAALKLLEEEVKRLL
eukprot:gnl/Dysnectes_brevis/7520_a12680_176.p2 GENE.gnl/Dysnectes_brevis/7520_a12680_176~~gnl/Dysnectes_brevis/7520_a12680_176.p2  ORF type:complete len:115 (+),score=42.49 gnl/Dysnectes_brevis/7520_a12680_176:2-346(+)